MKLFQLKRPFLPFTQILPAKHFSPIKINTRKSKIKSHTKKRAPFKYPKWKFLSQWVTL